MIQLDVLFRARRAVTAAGEVARCVGIRVGRIAAIEPYDAQLTAERLVDLDDDTIETCPHYLVFAAEEIPAGATQYKCCPPIREAENREQLWQHPYAGRSLAGVVRSAWLRGQELNGDEFRGHLLTGNSS